MATSVFNSVVDAHIVQLSRKGSFFKTSSKDYSLDLWLITSNSTYRRIKMIMPSFLQDQFKSGKNMFRWILWLLPLAVCIGLLVAFFLKSLDVVTQWRLDSNYFIACMPIAGVLIVWMYRRFGKNAAAGNDLIIDAIHEEETSVPLRMTPFILFSTLVTHLVGGSAGREGTAVQMGGSMAAYWSKLLKWQHEKKRILLMSGMAAGFSAVFGTPIAGCIFALEVPTSGKIKYEALFPCLFAAGVAHYTCLACGVSHTHYTIGFHQELGSFFSLQNCLLLLKVLLGGAIFGWVAFVFANGTHTLKKVTATYIPNPYLIPVLGAILVIGISFLLGNPDYLGLGVYSNPYQGVSIQSAFQVGGAETWSWFWKLLLTAITLSMGFKGGEVTPLFFIGATLGNTLGMFMGVPIDLMAALGFIAVFSGATNTPIACMIMGVELFGSEHLFYFAAVCFMAYYCSGHAGIYRTQQKAHIKTPIR